jgi:hypothetical protein
MTREQLYNLAKGKTGEIYIARKGTAMIFIIDGNTYLLSTTDDNNVVKVNPSPEYWTHSIDWAGGFSEYFTYQMCPPENLTYQAKPIVPIKPEHLDKLKSLIA